MIVRLTVSFSVSLSSLFVACFDADLEKAVIEDLAVDRFVREQSDDPVGRRSAKDQIRRLLKYLFQIKNRAERSCSFRKAARASLPFGEGP